MEAKTVKVFQIQDSLQYAIFVIHEQLSVFMHYYPSMQSFDYLKAIELESLKYW